MAFALFCFCLFCLLIFLNKVNVDLKRGVGAEGLEEAEERKPVAL